MTTQRWILVFIFSLASVLGTVELFKTKEAQTYTCRTIGSGIVQPFKGESYYVRSDCPFTLTSFTVNRREYSVTIRRGHNGLLVQVEIIINKVTTLLQNGHVVVQNKSVSLPYDHTYQHIVKYGIYTKLRSSLLPFTVTWHNVDGGINSLWVTLESELSTDMCGLCGKQNLAGHRHELIRDSQLHDLRCKTRDPVLQKNHVCSQFFRRTKSCLQDNNSHFHQLCRDNIFGFENSHEVFCPFFQEVASQCNQSRINRFWRRLTRCEKPSCPGDLIYEKKGPAFIPSCSNPDPAPFYQELTETCVCPRDKVFNNHAIGHHCIPESSCSCEFAGKSYGNGEIRSSKCQSCTCHGGKWRCSENLCHRKCVIEGQFVTTFDGKQYVLPRKCLYVASKGPDWMITIQFNRKGLSLRKVMVHLSKELFVFKDSKVVFEGREIMEFHQTDHAQVYWLSSMFVRVHTTIGIHFQIQLSPEIQLFIDTPDKSNDKIKGLCGNSNSDTTDDFTANSGIIENSAQPFALSWSLGHCHGNIPSNCTNRENENYAHEKCAVLHQPTGMFAKCHPHIPTDYYYTACIQRICNTGRSRREALCIGLASYAKACDGLGVVIGDWRRNTGCNLKCQKNQEFSYNMHTCNRTCTSLSGHDFRCDMDDDPVEGCGCPEGTYLNQGQTCSPKKECACTYYGGIADPGPVVISRQKCNCENGVLSCLPDCDCKNGKVCVSCSEGPVNIVKKTCDHIGKPLDTSETCESGCYCPDHQYEDHFGNCVSLDECTCVFSGKAFRTGQQVNSRCKTCTCYRGMWQCTEKPCPGQCQVYGDGHYQTFDSKWYRFSGQCLYTLVQDSCGNKKGTFSVRVESVPCNQNTLTCSRNIILKLQGKVTLTLSDMQVTRRLHKGWTGHDDSLYSIHTSGLYIVISVPSKGITLIWDKHTWITVELAVSWKNRVCGLCGNFDYNEMNDLIIRSSSVFGRLAFCNSWKVHTHSCSDVTTEIYSCQRNSYCTAWAQQRCSVITGETFSECHLKVDPDPYYVACVQESCSCELDVQFLGFCTAVAAYAQACSEQHVCVNWRTPDLCPIACDYYNEKGRCIWQYEACGEILTCGKENDISHKLEGCYPKCTKREPYYDENTGGCSSLRNCTCYFNGAIIQPHAVVVIQNGLCRCEKGAMNCDSSLATTPTSSTPPFHDSTTKGVTPMSSTPSSTDSTPEGTTGISSTPSSTDSTSDGTTGISSTPSSTDSTFEGTTPISSPPSSTDSTTTGVNPTSSTPASTDSTPESTTPISSTATSADSTPEGTTAISSTPSSTDSTSDGTTGISSTPSSTDSTSEGTTPISSPPSSTDSTTTGVNPTSSTPTSTDSTPEGTTGISSTPSSTNSTPEGTNPTSTIGFSTDYTNEGTNPTSSTPTSTDSTPEVTTGTSSTPTSTDSTTRRVTRTSSTHTSTVSTTDDCECFDLKNYKIWQCGEAWTEDCFNKTCRGGKIELTPVVCPMMEFPECPRDKFTKVFEGCCETLKCDCRCEIYGDSHYTTFQGVKFDFLTECTNILVKEISSHPSLYISVENENCVAGRHRSCAKSITVKYQGSKAVLSIDPDVSEVKVTLNGVVVQPPLQAVGFRFESTTHTVTIYIPELRSYVSLSESHSLVVSLAMEYFQGKTQGQCGVCGVGSCIRKGGKMEDNSCCDKTAYSWVKRHGSKPACALLPRDVECDQTTAVPPTTTTFLPCPSSALCVVLDHPAFSKCIKHLMRKKKICVYGSCDIDRCSILNRAAKECMKAGVCIDWRALTNGKCTMTCPKGLVYRQCRDKLDDFCLKGIVKEGAPFKCTREGCFCPHGQIKAEMDSNICVTGCPYCKGPLGEPKQPGDVWESGCHICECNKHTGKEECHLKPLETEPSCAPDSVLVNKPCCGEQICVEKTCKFGKKTYKAGESWSDDSSPCQSFHCSLDGIQTTTRECPGVHCHPARLVWDNDKCCKTCNNLCAPVFGDVEFSTTDCHTILHVPVCMGECGSGLSIKVGSKLRVHARNNCCQEKTSETKTLSAICYHPLTNRREEKTFTYKHITSCECRLCNTQH